MSALRPLLLALLLLSGALPAHAQPEDSDSDGYTDDVDVCPADGDMWGYGVDDSGCPTLPPDDDGDGYTNDVDVCPSDGDLYGAGIDGNGCPLYPPNDSDSDGFEDSMDNCPYDYNMDQADSDSDGTGDVCDTGGDYDSDGDGYYDNYDSCPNDGDQGYGVDGNGCPNVDSDGDGYYDGYDSCPNNGDEGYGVDGSGCPFTGGGDYDSDGDGYYDSYDSCPYDGDQGYGVDGSGCPLTGGGDYDSDGDGYYDSYDSCPNNGEEGYGVDWQGCPNPPTPYDTDGDGVEDGSDACPNNGDQGYGIDGSGCPIADSDGDGYYDDYDGCPYESDVYGYGVDPSGCPNLPLSDDSDGDGFTDDLDDCPGDGDIGYGLDGTGCPNPPPDADSDSVPDESDNCVSTDNADQQDTDSDGMGDACDAFSNDALLLLRQDGDAARAEMGSSVALADMNNDGVDDVIVGAPQADVLLDGELLRKAGEIRILSGVDGSLLQTIHGWTVNQSLGTTIAVRPDQDSDGIPELLVGEPLADIPKNTTGKNKTKVFRNAGRVLSYTSADHQWQTIAQGTRAGDRFGTAIAVGDVDTDGTPDLIVGAPHSDAAVRNAGQVLVFDGFGQDVLYVRNGTQAGGRFGAAIAVDGDRLFVGAPQYNSPAGKNAGRVFVFAKDNGIDNALLAIDGDAAGDAFGTAVTAGQGRWAVGAPQADNASRDAGTVKLFVGLDAEPVATVTGEHADDAFGSALNLQGDLDGDGTHDLAVGSPRLDARVTVDEKTARLKAAGQVEILSGTALW